MRPSRGLALCCAFFSVILVRADAVAATAADSGAVSGTAHPLVAKYTYTTSHPATVYVEFGEDTGYGRRTSAHQMNGSPGSLDILVAGMKALTTYHMRAVAQYSTGEIHYDSDHVFTTGAISVPLPTISVTRTALTPSSGVELLDLISPDPGKPSYPVVTDLDGNVIWYCPIATNPPIKLLPNGDLLLVSGPLLMEIDLTGATIRSTTVQFLNNALRPGMSSFQGFHHDFVLLPTGHTVLLTQTPRTVPTLESPSGTLVIDNGLIDLDENWRPRWSWDALDHLDVNRHPWWGLPDWLHSNAVIYDPRDKNLLVSIRHQNWIVKIDYHDGAGSGDVLWKLGYQGDFSLTGGGPADWFWAQHAPSFASFDSPTTEHIAIFDNGNHRTNDLGQSCGGAMPCYSRGLVMSVDEAAKTAQVAWEYQLPYSFWGGSAAQLGNGDLEFGMSPLDRVVEVSHDAVPQPVWQLTAGSYAYRGTRLPSLYPGVSW